VLCFGSADSKGVRGVFCRSADNKGLSGRGLGRCKESGSCAALGKTERGKAWMVGGGEGLSPAKHKEW
jgi:hypothetical protein